MLCEEHRYKHPTEDEGFKHFHLWGFEGHAESILVVVIWAASRLYRAEKERGRHRCKEQIEATRLEVLQQFDVIELKVTSMRAFKTELQGARRETCEHRVTTPFVRPLQPVPGQHCGAREQDQNRVRCILQ